LETATDVYYTTRAGKVWKNGLLGFNCRHYLVAYKDGLRFPKPNPKTEAREYKITEKQGNLNVTLDIGEQEQYTKRAQTSKHTNTQSARLRRGIRSILTFLSKTAGLITQAVQKCYKKPHKRLIFISVSPQSKGTNKAKLST
jgi:hypothetical protein